MERVWLVVILKIIFNFNKRANQNDRAQRFERPNARTSRAGRRSARMTKANAEPTSMTSQPMPRHLRLPRRARLWCVFAAVAVVGCYSGPPQALVFDAAVPFVDAAPPDAASADMAAPPGADLGETPGGGGDSNDTDIALVRLDASGALDPSFGKGGIARFDFGAGADPVRDTLWSVVRDAAGGFIVSGAKKASATRADLDRIVVRVGAAGQLDGEFATSGQYTFNLANLTDTPKNAILTPDGKIVAAGFTVVPTGVGTQTTDRTVWVRLWGGAADPTFGVNGIATLVPFIPADPVNTQWGLFEPGAVARQSSGALLTAGYGRVTSNGDQNVVVLRHSADGVFDTTFGSAGAAQLDVAKQTDRGRNLVVLPDDRFVVVGTSAPRSNVTHALIAFFGANGAVDPSFNGSGYKVYDFGLPSEEFYGAALSPSGRWLAAAGFRTASGSAADATLALVPLDPTAGSEFAAVTPLTADGDDRFWAVAFDASDRVYAAGYVVAEGDSRMAVARFDVTGTLDPSFGKGGIATVNCTVGGGSLEMARSLLVQPDGKVVLGGDCEH
jgi:uncharacterized delta-60 repeat protein